MPMRQPVDSASPSHKGYSEILRQVQDDVGMMTLYLINAIENKKNKRQ